MSNKNTLGCPFCADDPEQRIKEMFVDDLQAGLIASGQKPAPRAVFRKLHGIAHGYFEVNKTLSENFKVGIFKGTSFPAWVRFSSDMPPEKPSLSRSAGEATGIAIKLFGVEGEKLIESDNTFDFILQNHDVFFVDNAHEMCEISKNPTSYIQNHPETDQILQDIGKLEASVLTTTYWSVLPYKFGEAQAVKYKLEPEQADNAEPFDAPNYLALDLERRLRKGEARYRFMVQFQQQDDPLDKATVRWKGEWVQLATLVLSQQDITATGQAEYGENLAFNTWRVLPEHKPLGSLAAARKIAYAASAECRHEANGIPNQEPKVPRSTEPTPPPKDDCIVKAAIYPSIGIARVGSSRKAFFIGPEVTHPEPKELGFYRDEQGALKRQAARFRIYGLNIKGEVVKELNADNAEIDWKVHLANQKSAWYQFQLALDIPEAKAVPPSLLRNISVKDRSQLVIDSGSLQIKGKSKGDESEYRFDTGHFMNIPIELGELKTDEQGRLLVLGGFGYSVSYNGSKAVTFGNNETWCDDISDGPVTATVRYEGQVIETDPAWVVVAPPNYGPQLKSVRTMWDLMRDVAIKAEMLTKPSRPSFTDDILPIFKRMTDLQWVNKGFAVSFGWKAPFDFDDAEWLSCMSDPSPTQRGLRRTLYHQFREYKRDDKSPIPWPYLYGDAMSLPAISPRQYLMLSNTQMAFLKQWAEGDFISDYDPDKKPITCLEDVPVAEQADTLTKAALEFCLADAFHPGCEMTWPVRSSSMYMSAFRFKHAEPDWIEPKYGAQMNLNSLNLPDGPLEKQMPGSISRWMAVPWQTDTASCRSGYDSKYDPYIPSFWPARVPNQVLTEDAYKIVMDDSEPLEKRRQAFAQRPNWYAALGAKNSYTKQLQIMIHHFDEMGVVEVRPGPTDSTDFPETIQVADRDHVIKEDGSQGKSISHLTETGSETELQNIEKVNRYK